MADPTEDLSKSARWNVTRDSYFVEQLIHQESIGQRQDSVWSKTAWRNVSVSFNEKFNTSYNVKMFKTRLTKLKERYNIVKGLLVSSGFGWDDQYHMVIAKNKLWDDYIRVNNKIKPFRGKTFPLYDQLGVIFDGTIAEEKDALSTIRSSSESKERENESSSSIPITDATASKNFEKDVAPVCDDETSQEVSDENRVKGFFNNKYTSIDRVRRRNESTGEKLIELVEYSFVECLKELKLIEGLHVDEVMKGAHALKDEQNRMAFMTFEGADRLAFLRSCFD